MLENVSVQSTKPRTKNCFEKKSTKKEHECSFELPLIKSVPNFHTIIDEVLQQRHIPQVSKYHF